MKNYSGTEISAESALSYRVLYIITLKMKCDISSQRIDPVLAPDQFGVA